MVKSDSHSDERDTRLLLRAGRGNATAFQQLHARLHGQVRGFVGTVGPWLATDLLDEAVQETFLRVWRAAPTFRGEASARTYLFSLARNTVFEITRRERRQLLGRLRAALQWAGRLDKLEAPASELGDQAGGNMAELARSRLSPGQWGAMYLVVIKGLTPREASQYIGCSPGAVYDRLYRARLKLRAVYRTLGEPVRSD